MHPSIFYTRLLLRWGSQGVCSRLSRLSKGEGRGTTPDEFASSWQGHVERQRQTTVHTPNLPHMHVLDWHRHRDDFQWSDMELCCNTWVALFYLNWLCMNRERKSLVCGSRILCRKHVRHWPPWSRLSPWKHDMVTEFWSQKTSLTLLTQHSHKFYIFFRCFTYRWDNGIHRRASMMSLCNFSSTSERSPFAPVK